MEGTEMLCHDNIRGLTWETQLPLSLKRKLQSKLASGFCMPSHSPAHTPHISWQRTSSYSGLCWGAENVSRHSASGSGLWQGDITSPFPPSGKEGYVRNWDVPYRLDTRSNVVMTLGVLWKVPQPLNAVTTCGAANDVNNKGKCQCMSHNLPNAPAQIHPWNW